MTLLLLLQDWQVVLIPVAVMIISQTIKVCLDSRDGGFQWSHLNSYGGMPSSHTAMSVSLLLMVGQVAGWNSPLFAVTAVMAAVFIRDAFGIRWSLGYHAKVLNLMIHMLPAHEQAILPKHLEERLGHRRIEVIAGAVVGAVVTGALYWLINYAG